MIDHAQRLRDRIARREAKVGVLGLGYVGLPLVTEFAKAGFHVVGFDVTKGKVDALNRGVSYIPDVPTSEVAELREKGLIEATTDMGRIAELDAVSICVPTPLSKTKDPDMSFVEAAADAARHCNITFTYQAQFVPTIPAVQCRALEGALRR